MRLPKLAFITLILATCITGCATTKIVHTSETRLISVVQTSEDEYALRASIIYDSKTEHKSLSYPVVKAKVGERRQRVEVKNPENQVVLFLTLKMEKQQDHIIADYEIGKPKKDGSIELNSARIIIK